MSLETENKDNQKMMDKMIEEFSKKGKFGHAKNAALLGGASKSVVEKAILPCLKAEVEDLEKTAENNPAGIYSKEEKISDTIRLLDSYGIKPVEMIDKTVDYLLKVKFFGAALSLAEKGLEETHRKAIKVSLEEEDGKSVFNRMDIGNNKEEKIALVLKVLKNS